MIAEKVFNIALTLIDEAPINGTFDTNNTADYRARAPYLLNALCTELLPLSNYTKTYNISNKPLIPVFGTFDVKQHGSTDMTFETELSRAYYFETQGPATVYIEDYTTEWNVLATINASNSSTFVAYGGKVTPTTGATRTRIRFSGDYTYNFTNIALFKENIFGDVPAYRPYIKYTLPNDYSDLVEIINDSVEYQRQLNYNFEGINFYLPYDFEGNIRIIYKPILTEITDLSQTLELDSAICTGILPYGLGAKIILNENSAIASYLSQRYEELKRDIKKDIPSERQKIIEVYGADCNF